MRVVVVDQPTSTREPAIKSSRAVAVAVAVPVASAATETAVTAVTLVQTVA